MMMTGERTPVLQDSWGFTWKKNPTTREEILTSMMIRCNMCGVQFLRERPLTVPRTGGFHAVRGGYEIVCKNDDELHVFYVKDEINPRG